MTEFVWREVTHRKTGRAVPGCFAWHHRDEALCDHEHKVDDQGCEDARIEMSNLRAAEKPKPLFAVEFAEQLAHWERMLVVMPPGPERSAVDDMLRSAKKSVEDVSVAGMLRSFGEMKDMKVSPWVVAL